MTPSPKSPPRTKRLPEQPAREKRILYEAVVDAYDDTERAMGWYYHLQNEAKFPFAARCISKRSTSPLEVGQEVQVVGQAVEDDCMSELLVMVKLGRSKLAVPLDQLECLVQDAATLQVVEDWHYWVGRGYRY